MRKRLNGKLYLLAKKLVESTMVPTGVDLTDIFSIYQDYNE